MEHPLRIPLSKHLEEFSPFSDKFINPVEGSHFLFSGCSITAGESLRKEQTWSWKLYNQLTQNQDNKNTFFNVACSGMSITEAIDQIFKYCHDFGNPDAIFMLLPDPGRDFRYCNPEPQYAKSIQILIYKSYFYLESFCKANNIKLISSTWYKNASKIENKFLPSKKVKYYPGTNVERTDWGYQLNHMEHNPLEQWLKDFDTFYNYTEEDMTAKVLEYHLTKTKEEKLDSLVASDDVHPGSSFHDFWKDFFYEKYMELA